jgi:hypothetical protein
MIVVALQIGDTDFVGSPKSNKKDKMTQWYRYPVPVPALCNVFWFSVSYSSVPYGTVPLYQPVCRIPI